MLQIITTSLVLAMTLVLGVLLAGIMNRPLASDVRQRLGNADVRRWMTILVPCAATLGFLNSASASALIIDEPTILGPSASVHHVTNAGYDNTLDWVEAQGITNPEVNAALWQASLSPGDYLLEAWIPALYGNTYARYAITHSGETNEVRLHQRDFANVWVPLGTYAFDESQASVRSTDASGVPGEHEQLAWDAMRWTPVSAIPPNVEVEGPLTTINEPQVSGPEEFVVRFVGIGYRGDLLRTYAQGGSSEKVNLATWSVPLTAGTYEVEVYVPSQHGEAEVDYTMHALGGNVSMSVAQANYKNVWVSLGRYAFGESATVTSSDATGVIGQEIAWDAMRFKALPVEKPVGEKPLEKMVEPPVGGGGTKALATIRFLEPLVPEQNGLIAFIPRGLRLGRRGPKLAGGRGYSIRKLYPVPKSLKLTYRCLPCVFVASPLRLRPRSRKLLTHTSRAHGDLRKLVGKTVLYRDTVLQVEAAEDGYRPRRYLYRLPASGRVPSPMECTAATPASVKGCAP